MPPGPWLAELTAHVLAAASAYLANARPAAFLVQCDSTNVLATRLAAEYARVPLGHLEARLPTRDMNLPWPEEINRRLISPLAHWSFALTEGSRQNLLHE